MTQIYPFIIAFFLVFLSELGDKTQLLVLSFSRKTTSFSILLGVALGSFFSHGIAIWFGSSLSLIGHETFHSVLQIITFCSFFIFGIFSFLPCKEGKEENSNTKPTILHRLAKIGLRLCLYYRFFYSNW